MDSFIDNIYPTPLYIADISKDEGFNSIQNEANIAVKSSIFNSREDWGPTHYLSDTSFSKNIIKDSAMHTLELTLHIHLEKYMSMIGFDMLPYITTSWLSLFRPGQYGHVHNHGTSDVSGCYYVKTTGDGDIFFEDPRPAHDTSYVFSGKYMSGGRAYKPEVGRMLLFPGYLNHGIKTNTSSEDRISLAFNIKFIDPRFKLKDIT